MLTIFPDRSFKVNMKRTIIINIAKFESDLTKFHKYSVEFKEKEIELSVYYNLLMKHFI